MTPAASLQGVTLLHRSSEGLLLLALPTVVVVTRGAADRHRVRLRQLATCPVLTDDVRARLRLAARADTPNPAER